MLTTRQWEIQNPMFRTPVHSLFFPDFLGAQNMVRVIKGKIILIEKIRGRGETEKFNYGTSS